MGWMSFLTTREAGTGRQTECSNQGYVALSTRQGLQIYADPVTRGWGSRILTGAIHLLGSVLCHCFHEINRRIADITVRSGRVLTGVQALPERANDCRLPYDPND